MKGRDFEFDYFGFDNSMSYINVGLVHFPELKNSYICGDFQDLRSIRTANVSVVSATLRHIDDWELFLRKILSTTKDLVLIRTFLANSTKRSQISKGALLQPYPVWEFGFDHFAGIVGDAGWSGQILLDEATGSVPKWINGHELSPGLVRTCYIAALTR